MAKEAVWIVCKMGKIYIYIIYKIEAHNLAFALKKKKETVMLN